MNKEVVDHSRIFSSANHSHYMVLRKVLIRKINTFMHEKNNSLIGKTWHIGNTLLRTSKETSYW